MSSNDDRATVALEAEMIAWLRSRGYTVTKTPSPNRPWWDGMSARTVNALRDEGMLDLDKLAQTPDARLLRLISIGRKSLHEIHQVLADHGFDQRP